jgi:hypothetical protein
MVSCSSESRRQRPASTGTDAPTTATKQYTVRRSGATSEPQAAASAQNLRIFALGVKRASMNKPTKIVIGTVGVSVLVALVMIFNMILIGDIALV